MIDIKVWMDLFCRKLMECFNDRIKFVGLQGSYARNEANENSDIDVVVILDKLQAEDLHKYSSMLDSLPDRKLVCGFISGMAELLKWVPSDLFQFYFDTVPVIGSLDILSDIIDENSIYKAEKIGVCNIYHACVHNMVHEKDFTVLKNLYKSAVFVIQAKYYIETKTYIRQKQELLKCVSEPDRGILEYSIKLANSSDADTYDFTELSDKLFQWAQGLIYDNEPQIIIYGEDIILEQAAAFHKRSAEKMKEEFFSSGENIINGSALFDQMDFDSWLENTTLNHNPETVRSDWAVATTFFAVRKSDRKIIGMIDVRHELTVPFLKEYGGHIGYAVCPSERRKGYCTQMLKLAVEYCSSIGVETIRLGCYSDNIASIKVMERCGGVRAEEKPYTDGKPMYIYQIG